MKHTKKPTATVPQKPAEIPDPIQTAMSELAEVAFSTVTGARQSEYGDKLANFTQIALAFDAILARKLLPGQHITPLDVAWLMMQVKLVRLAHMPGHKDSLLDVVGYAMCAEAIKHSEAGDIPHSALQTAAIAKTDTQE